MSGEGYGWFLSQVTLGGGCSWACHYLTPLTFEPGGGPRQTPEYTYVNS
jgi:hypothetical protein